MKLIKKFKLWEQDLSEQHILQSVNQIENMQLLNKSIYKIWMKMKEEKL